VPNDDVPQLREGSAVRIRLNIDIDTDESTRTELAERVVEQPVVEVTLPGFGAFNGRFTGATGVEEQP
jgi:hypothetical protein